VRGFIELDLLKPTRFQLLLSVNILNIEPLAKFRG